MGGSKRCLCQALRGGCLFVCEPALFRLLRCGRGCDGKCIQGCLREDMSAAGEELPLEGEQGSGTAGHVRRSSIGAMCLHSVSSNMDAATTAAHEARSK